MTANSISKLLKKFMVNESAIFYMIVTMWLLVFSYDFYQINKRFITIFVNAFKHILSTFN